MQLKYKVQYQYVIDIMEMPQQGQRINVKFYITFIALSPKVGLALPDMLCEIC